jgi:hypothetical protein
MKTLHSFANSKADIYGSSSVAGATVAVCFFFFAQQTMDIVVVMNATPNIASVAQVMLEMQSTTLNDSRGNVCPDEVQFTVPPSTE